MTAFHAICLGIIQGVTEFMPISSSMHLVLFSKLVGLQAQRHSFDIFLTLGTSAAILVYFFHDIVALFRGFCDFITNKESENRTAFFTLFVSTLPAMIVCGIVEFFFGLGFKSYRLVAVSLMFFAIVLWFCDTKPTTKDKISMRDGIIIGMSQVISIIPGVSRLGISLSAARYLNYSRLESFKFSMLLSTSFFLGACVLTFAKIFTGQINIENWGLVFIGTVFSFVFGLITLHFMTRFLSKHTFILFVPYRIALAVFVFVWFCCI